MFIYLPIDPTEEMLDAATKGYAEEYKQYRKKIAAEIYRAMVKEYIKQTQETKL